MASIIPGYSYDVFISYRQKDNKHDGWVTEFVENLKGELEATFKEDISVYFDINPHDGLLETHDVDASLKDKLKCLVFIPIISRTYCDPKSFAWEHEFISFIDLATNDRFGLKVRLPDGNISSRILPVRIHDLDVDDAKLWESAVGGVLRGVEFIYKSPGINRPLRLTEDRPNENLNKNSYRDQINKVALAIKEIIKGLKLEPPVEKAGPGANQVIQEKYGQGGVRKGSGKKAWWRFITAMVMITVLAVSGFLIFRSLKKPYPLEHLRSNGPISVAVMPYQNITNDTAWNGWQLGVQKLLITSLSYYENLKVRQSELVNSLIQFNISSELAAVTSSEARKLSRKLDADVFIHGTIIQAGVSIKVIAELSDARSGDIIKSFQQEGPAREDNIFEITELLASQISDFLVITTLEKKERPDFKNFGSTSSPQAYMKFVYGMKAWSDMDYESASDLLSEAVRIDTNFIYASIMLSWTYLNQGMVREGRNLCLKTYKKKSQVNSLILKALLDYTHSTYTESPNEWIFYLKQLQDLDPVNPEYYSDLGVAYNQLGRVEDAITEIEKALAIYKKWKIKPFWVHEYTYLGSLYHETGQYTKEKRIYRHAERDFPDDPAVVQMKAVLALSKGRMKKASEIIDKYIFLCQDHSITEVDISTGIASIYSRAGDHKKAVVYYREALRLEKNFINIYRLAMSLVENDLNIEEGMELADEGLKMGIYEDIFLGVKALGFFKLGRYIEALDYINKADSLKLRYNRTIFLYKPEIEKAVASLKNN